MENIVYILVAVGIVFLLFIGFLTWLSRRSNKDMKAWELILISKANEDESVDARDEGLYHSFVVTRNHALELKRDCYNLKQENNSLRMELAYYRGLLGLNQSNQAV